MINTQFLFNTIRLKALSPVHIGEGRKLKAVDLIYKNGKLYVLDEKKVVAWIARDIKRAHEFSSAVRNPMQVRMEDVFHRLGAGDWSEFVAYQLGVIAQRSPGDVTAFIKSPENQPYLPGSSLKGSLRSAWLRGISIADKNLRSKFTQLVNESAKVKKSASQDIEATVFSPSGIGRDKRSNYDINRLIQVRDSAPLPLNNFRVIETKVISSTGEGILKGKHYSIFVEALTSGTTVELITEWQAYLLDGLASQLRFSELLQRIVYLPEYCRAASLNIMAQERDFYSRHGEKRLAEWFDTKLTEYSPRSDLVFPLPLGWGSGYDPKTITDLLPDDTFEVVVKTYKSTKGLGKPGRNPDARWLGPAKSPKSRKVAIRRDHGLDEYEPIGWVEISFLPLDGQDGLSELRSNIASPPELNLLSGEYHNIPTTEVSPAQKSPKEGGKPPVQVYPEKPPAKEVKESFTSLPKPGDQFYGVVFDVTINEVLLEIPGLDADSQAYAVLKAEDNPLLGRPREKQRILCEVLDLLEESKGYWRVRCRLG